MKRKRRIDNSPRTKPFGDDPFLLPAQMRWLAANTTTALQPRWAASIAAMSIFFIPIIASKALCFIATGGKRVGQHARVICQEIPHCRMSAFRGKADVARKAGSVRLPQRHLVEWPEFICVRESWS